MNKIIKFINYKFEEMGQESFVMYFSLLILNIAIITVFVFLSGLHLYFKHMDMVALCSTMVALFFIVNILINSKKYESSFYIMLFLMSIYVYLKIQILGSQTSVHILMLYFVIPQFTYNFTKRKKILINILILLVLCYAIITNSSGVSKGSYEQSIIFAKFNILALYLILLVQLTSSTFISKMIEKIKQRELEFFKNKSEIDDLTGLNNRYFAEKYFNRVKISNQKKGYILAFVDIDDFKKINDSYGHLFGDMILKEVGKTALSQFRKNDLICRWGGEEFLIVLEGVDIKRAEDLLNRFRSCLKEIKIAYGKIDIGMTVTIGVAKVKNKDFEAAIAIADDNLYKGKRNGKDIVII